MADLFNGFSNTSNDYIYPDLPLCPNVNEPGAIFKFLPKQQAGVISGNDVLSSLDLSDISQNISNWYQQTKMLQPGEVIFIQGMSKGISQRKQYFPFSGTVEYTGANHQYYMSVDLSINYFKSFKNYFDNIFATANIDNNVDIATALNMKFDSLGISINASYDPSGLTFKAQTAGYLFDIKTVDVSLWEPDSSIFDEVLSEDASLSIPAFKYPNTAMLGYVLKATYPSGTLPEESYVNINHVPDYLEWFETLDSSCYIRHYDAVDVGATTTCELNTLSAGDYLNYVETNKKWEKVGLTRVWLSCNDPDESNIENLITGFYVYNPQTFPVYLTYLIIS